MPLWSRVKQKGMTITSCKVKGKALKHANHNSVPIKTIDGFTLVVASWVIRTRF